MKNYLFAPFKDEEDKMDTWNSCKSGIDQGIMIFLGRLESSYDVIISDLKADKELVNAHNVNDLLGKKKCGVLRIIR